MFDTRRFLFAILVALPLLVGACSKDNSADSRAVGRIVGVQGSAEITRGEAVTPAVAGYQLREGDLLSVSGSSNLSFRLDGEELYELIRGGAALGPAGRLALDGAIVILNSDELVEIDLDSIALSLGGGAMRLELGGEGRVAAYEAEDLLVASGDQQIPVPPLWQISVGSDGRLDNARPIQFSRDDPVDAIHLAYALEVDARVGNLLRGLEPQLLAAGESALTNRLESAGIGADARKLFASASQSDQLMGLAFVREWKKQAPEELVKGFEQVMALKVLGATWGLAAQIFDVDGEALMSSLQNEITAVLFPADSAGQPQPLVPASPAPPSQGAPVVPPPAPVPPAPASPTPTSPDGLLAPVLDPLRPLLPSELEAIVDELYGLVGGLLPGL